MRDDESAVTRSLGLKSGAGALAALMSTTASPSLDAVVQEAKLNAITALTSPEALKVQVGILTQSIFDAQASGDMETAATAMDILFDIACSGSGTTVQAEGEVTASGVGVLILGFAGSSLRVLGGLIALYRKLYPEWKVVATVASGLANDPVVEAQFALERQTEQVLAGLAGCKRLLVHCLSNNGQGLFASLLHRKSSVLRSRVAAVVYDCAAARKHILAGQHLSGDEAAAQSAKVVTSTVFMPLLEMQVTVCDPKDSNAALSMRSGAPFRGPLEEAALYSAHRWRTARGGKDYFWANRYECGEGEGVHEYDARRAPHVPVLCLTSPDDKIISVAAVEDWAGYLRDASGGTRDVELLTLPSGSHCMLLQSHHERYAAALQALVARAKLDEVGAPIQDAAAKSGAAAGSQLGKAFEQSGVAHLAVLEGLRDLGLDGCCALYEELGRTKFIGRCKELGVESLGERQKVASVVAKASKERGGAAAVSVS